MVIVICFIAQVIAQQQEETAAMVDKQSSEMLEMMKEKKKELESDLETVQQELDEAVCRYFLSLFTPSVYSHLKCRGVGWV